ncbi:MAG: hypothetical protein JW881_01510 [Spirochaetales bacterium]|nr:hypothetical protein [Spirochaetales bacterium]
MAESIEILRLKIADRYIGCSLDEVEKVITDVTGLSSDKKGPRKKQRNIYRLGDILRIPGEVEYSSLIVLGSDPPVDHMFIAIPPVTDVVEVPVSHISVVPDYIRRKQKPFVVWGFVVVQKTTVMLVTFSHFTHAMIKDG